MSYTNIIQTLKLNKLSLKQKNLCFTKFNTSQNVTILLTALC